MSDFLIGSRLVGPDQPTYFIADVAANHDGSLERAKSLMTLAQEAGADCAKFQHFRAEHIVSDFGFKALGGQQSHQASWDKSVFEVYQAASLPWEWTAPLAAHAQQIGIEFMSAPYDLEAVAHLDPYVNAFKVGSGDINWLDVESAGNFESVSLGVAETVGGPFTGGVAAVYFPTIGVNVFVAGDVTFFLVFNDGCLLSYGCSRYGNADAGSDCGFLEHHVLLSGLVFRALPILLRD